MRVTAYQTESEQLQKMLLQGAKRVVVRSRLGMSLDAFFGTACMSLEESGYRCIRFSRSASAGSVPLAAMSGLLGVVDGDARLSTVADGIVQRIGAESSRTVLVVDSPQKIDKLSLEILLAASVRHSIPLLFGETIAEAQENTVSALGHADFSLHLGGRGYTTIERELVARYGNFLSETVVSEVFAVSAGILEVATAIVGAALSKANPNPLITFSGRAWCRELTPIIDELLSPVTSAEQDVLARLSLNDLHSRQAMLDDIDPDVLDRLERLQLIEARQVQGVLSVLISPPLLSEYFNSEMLPLKRASVLRAQDGTPMSFLKDQLLSETHAPDAFTVRTAHEVLRTRAIVARNLYQASPTAGSALGLMRELMAGEPVWEEISDLIASMPDAVTSEEDARLLALTACAIAFVGGDTPKAIDLLAASRDSYPVQSRRLLDVARVEIELRIGSVEPCIDDLLEADDSLPAHIQAPILEMRAYVLAACARFTEARATLDKIGSSHTQYLTARKRVAEVLVLVGEGRLNEAERIAFVELNRARFNYDTEGIWCMTYAVGMVQVIRGNTKDSVALLNSILSLGSPPPLCGPEASAILAGAAVVASWTHKPLGARIKAIADELRERTKGLLPGMPPEWVHVMSMKPSEPITTKLLEQIQATWLRGGKFASILTMSLLVSKTRDPDAMASLLRYAEGVTSPLVESALLYAEASLSGDASSALRAGFMLESVGRLNLASEMYTNVLNWATEDDSIIIASAKERLSGVGSIDAHSGADIAVQRHSELTSREAQVAQLISSGLSNGEIGEHLRISVRTAETHVYHVMQKLGVSSRGEMISLPPLQRPGTR